MNVSQLVQQYMVIAAHMADASLAIDLLLCFVLNKTKEQLFLSPNYELTIYEKLKFQALFQRYIDGEPVAYLIGKKEFYGQDFYVDSRVLIPRPETEILVDKVLDFLSQHKDLSKVLDVGTGSGCIAISICLRARNLTISGVDISDDALEVARINAQRLGVGNRVRFYASDLLSNVHDYFDIIVANLPYIGQVKFNFVSKEAQKYEPNVALFGGDDGLGLYERLFQQVCALEHKPKFLLGEFGFLQGESMLLLLKKYFESEDIQILEDYASIERVFVVAFRQ